MIKNTVALSAGAQTTLRQKLQRPLLTSAVALWTIAGGSSALAGPEGGQVVGGTGTISQPDSVTTRIDQATDRLAINWQSFNVAADERVQFVQPGSNSLALNRILDQNPSQIFGAIDANGRVLLVNANGMIFGRTASVNVAGLVATSLDVNPGAFMNGGAIGLAASDGTEGGLIANDGVITATPGGFVVLTGGAVLNTGVVVADLGSIELAAGHAATLDFRGDRMILFQVDQAVAANLSAAQSAIANSGTLQADGGQILLTAAAAHDLFTSVINNSGVIRANRIDNSGGVVRLVGAGGDTVHTGVIDVSAGDDVSTGGSVQVLGDRVGLFGNASIDASGATGGGDVLVGGDYQGANPAVANSRQTDMAPNAVITADAGQSGDGGRVIVWADGQTRFAGAISARGGADSGNGGFVETSGKGNLISTGSVNAGAANGLAGNWLLDPAEVTITNLPTADGVFDGLDPNTFTPNAPANTATVDVADIVTSLGLGTDVIILSNNATGTGSGDIIVGADIVANTPAGGATLTLNAFRDVLVDFGITGTGDALGVTLIATRNVDVNAAITTNGGTFNSSGVVFNNTDGTIDVGAGSLSITHSGNVTLGTLVASNPVTVSGVGTLSGPDASAVWTISGPDVGTLVSGGTTVNFTGFTSLTGGTDNDTFKVNSTLSGKVDGGTGTGTTNTLDYAARSGLVAVNLADTSATGIFGDANTGFSNINKQIGNDATTTTTSTLTGANAVNTWTVNAANDGNIGAGFTFENVGNLTGGTDNDTFKVNSTLSGKVDGGTGTGTTNTLDYAARSGTVAVNLADTSATGIFGDANTGFSNINKQIGNDATTTTTSTLTGANAVNTWTVNAANDGNIGAGFTFENVGNLTGGTDNDTFKVNSTLSGKVDGGTGTGTTNTLDYAARSGTVAVNLADTSATGIFGDANTGFSNINKQIGNDATTTTTSTLTGANAVNTWTVNAANDGNIGAGFTFENVGNLTGGTDNDTFKVNSTLSGKVDGGTGTGTTNTLDYAARSGTVAVNLADTSATGIFGDANTGFSNINKQIGNDATTTTTSTLTGANAVNTWTVNAANDGNIGAGFTFENVGNLTGGTDNDTFKVNSTLSGKVDGGTGTGTTNTLDYAARSGLVAVNLADTSATGIFGDANTGFSNINKQIGNDATTTTTSTLTGANAVNTWTVNAANDGNIGAGFTFENVGNLTGGTDNDTFKVNSTLSGKVDGGTGTGTTNTLDYAARSGTVAVNLADTSATGIFGDANTGFSNINKQIGNDATTTTTSTLTGANAVNTWTVNAANDGNIGAGFTFENVGNLTGGTNADNFALNGTSASISGLLAAGGGVNTLTFDVRDVAVVVTDATAGSGRVNTAATGVGTTVFGDVIRDYTGLSTVTGGGATVDARTGTLINLDTTATIYMVTDVNKVVLAGKTYNLASVTGTAGPDEFQFENSSAKLSGTLTGNGDSDTLNFANFISVVGPSAFGAAIVVTDATAGNGWVNRATSGNGAGPSGNVIGNFIGIDIFQGSTAGSGANVCCLNSNPLDNVFSGDALTVVENLVDRSWSIGSTTSTVGNATFTNIERVTAGSGNDTVALTGAPTAAGLFSFDAGSQSSEDTLDVAVSGFSFNGDLVWSNFELVQLGSGSGSGMTSASGNIWMYQVREVESRSDTEIELVTPNGNVIFSAAPPSGNSPLFAMTAGTTDNPFDVNVKAQSLTGQEGGREVTKSVASGELVVIGVNLAAGQPNTPVTFDAVVARGSNSEEATRAQAASQRSSDRAFDIPSEAAYTISSYEVTAEGVALPCDQRLDDTGCTN